MLFLSFFPLLFLQVGARARRYFFLKRKIGGGVLRPVGSGRSDDEALRSFLSRACVIRGKEKNHHFTPLVVPIVFPALPPIYEDARGDVVTTSAMRSLNRLS